MAAKELAPENPAIGALAAMAKTNKRFTKQEKLAVEKEIMFYSGLTDAEAGGSRTFNRAIPPYGGYPATPSEPNTILPVPGMGPPGAIATSDDPVAFRLEAMRRARAKGSDGSRVFASYMTDAERKEYAAKVGQELGTPVGTGSVGNAATAAALGDSFQYTIDHPVNLARQKSAMLPIVGKTIEGQKLSIYNESVQRTHPLLGLKFKNTSGAHLNQGPITVFEGSVYAGDTRVLDVQPNEERLVSYAIDLGTEVDPQIGAGSQKIISVKAVKGVITQSAKLTEEKKYKIVNRSQTDRTLLIEHPNRTNDQFKLVDTDNPIEDTPDVFRFQITVKAGETKTFTVKEEKPLANEITLTNNADDAIRYFTNLTEASPKLKQQLQEAFKVKEAWGLVRREEMYVLTDLERLNQDQERIRKNLRETPKEAEVYQAYLKKLSDQEKEIDSLTVKQKKLMDDEFKARSKYDDFLANTSD